MNNRGQYTVKTLPTIEPVTLTEAKAHLKVDFTEEDTLIEMYIAAARDYAEKYCNRALMTQTIVQSINCFPPYRTADPYRKIRLYRTPVQELVAIRYVDSEGNDASLDLTKVVLSKIAIPAVISPKSGENWPTTAIQVGAIEIEYTAGIADVAKVPPTIKSAVLLLVGEMYERRENFVKTMPDAVKYLLHPYRVTEF